MDHLLARLEVDESSAVCKRLVELLFNSYMPVDKPPEVMTNNSLVGLRNAVSLNAAPTSGSVW